MLVSSLDVKRKAALPPQHSGNDAIVKLSLFPTEVNNVIGQPPSHRLTNMQLRAYCRAQMLM